MDLEKIRKDFPILSENIVYLDSACTSLTPRQVMDSIEKYYYEYGGCAHRGVHRLSQEASQRYREAREKVAGFIGSKESETLVFTRNATEAINMVARGLCFEKGDKIVTSVLEHHSNFLPWLRLSKEKGVRLEIVECDREGNLKPEDFEEAVDEKTKLVAFTHASNSVGSVTPAEKICDIAREAGALSLLDGSQSVPHMPVDVSKIGCDFLAFSGHKMLGPTGVGVLYVDKKIVDGFEPLLLGGGAVSDVDTDYWVLAESPARFEAGVPNISGAVGLSTAVEYLQKVGLEKTMRHEKKLLEKTMEGFSQIKNLEVYGMGAGKKLGIVSFNVLGVEPDDVAVVLDNAANIMVRSGHHCALPFLKHVLGKAGGTVRASFYLYNTLEEVEFLVEAVEEFSKTNGGDL